MHRFLFLSTFFILPLIVSSQQYIVTFLSYLPQLHHETTIRTALALTPPTFWRFHHRHNLAVLNHPTDFLIVETPHTSILSILESHPQIRRVSHQAIHSRHPAAIRLPTQVEETSSSSQHIRHHPHLTLHPFRAGSLWRRGYTGKGVSVAVFDTGLLSDHTHFPNIASQTDWTGENTTKDHVGHGSFVAGIIAGHHPACPGLAPDVQLHIFRVFTASQVSYTSWFLDAFNYALHIGIDILNLSIGGPDFADNPFTEKIDELAAHGIIAVSAIGNDGPLWGSLNNPGDMMPVVGVGGAEPTGRVASFSSRGMTTHELDHIHQSYGRVKPDIVAYARSLFGPSHRAVDRCKRLSGTSVASPVVAGAIALLASTIPESRRRRVVTPASVKRALIASAHRLPIASMYEQGAGLLDIEDAFEEMAQIDDEFMRVERTEGTALDYASRFLRPFGQPVSISAKSKRRNYKTSAEERNSYQILHTKSRRTDDAGNAINEDALTNAAESTNTATMDSIDESKTQTKTKNMSNVNIITDNDDDSLVDDDDDNNNTNPNVTPVSSESIPLKIRRRRLNTIFTDPVETIPGPSAAFFPSYYDLRTVHCTHMWPHCAQALFEGAMPVHLNVTILNPGGIEGRVERVTWDQGPNGRYLNVRVTKPHQFWPWAAGMGIHLSAAGSPSLSSGKIEAEGILRVRVISVHEKTHSDIELPIKADVISPPPKEKRLLWDMYHSIRYPPGYVPRDSLAETKDMLDWLGDHPHTNYHKLFREFISAGYFIDLMNQPLSCIGVDTASKYAAILILDSEDYFSMNDTNVMEQLVKVHGVSLIVAAEWYNLDVMGAIRFEDDNTRSWWSPVISGGNVPALNELLSRFDIALGDEVFSGSVKLGSFSFLFESGVAIVRFPLAGELLYVTGLRHYETGSKSTTKSVVTTGGVLEMPVLGLTKSGNGAVFVYGDTNCLDTAYAGAKCYSFFVQAVTHTIQECAGATVCKRLLRQSVVTRHGLKPAVVKSNPTPGERLSTTAMLKSGQLNQEAKPLPENLLNVFKAHSKYDLKWDCGYNSTRNAADRNNDETKCLLQPILDNMDICRRRTGLQNDVDTIKPGIGRPVTVVSFPPLRQAAPVGTESGYYEEMKDMPPITTEDNVHGTGEDGNNGDGQTVDRASLYSGAEVRRVFTDGIYNIRLRSLSLILLGVCLMFASISLRRMGHRGVLSRRHGGRIRSNWKGSGIGASSKTGRSGGHSRNNNHDSNNSINNQHHHHHNPGFASSNSFVRLNCSSSSSLH